MSERNHAARMAAWLTGGGLVILAAQHWLFVYKPQLSFDNLILLAGALAGYLTIAVGLFLAFGRKREITPAAPPNTGMLREIQPESTEAERPETHDGPWIVRSLIRDFLHWNEDHSDDQPLWSSFDQLLREMLGEHLGAARVRAFHVSSNDQQLCGLSQTPQTGEQRNARGGILGYVATTGREFYAPDSSHGELINQLAVDGEESWDWIIPIRRGGQTIGLVATGKLSIASGLCAESRRDIGRLLTLFWEQTACRCRLSVANTTDKASGLLTRGDFFTSANTALSSSYAENEPVVAVVLALEGLRRLDDVGRWIDRDRLVENIGHVINGRIRTDDIIGRFSDDRFVLLLRRLDSGLGRLIAVKIQGAVRTEIAKLGELSAGLRTRIGLTGSGFGKEPLESLLARAFDAVEHARKQGVELYTDLAGPDNATESTEKLGTAATTEREPS